MQILGKACQILTSSGLAPDTEDTWTQLSAKHPKSPPPVPPAHPPLPLTSPILHQKVGFNSNRKVEDFNVLSILRSFSKASAAGPTGLRIQHLLDVAEVPVPTSICSLLRGVINLLASGQAPAAISQYMVGGSLVALRKGTQDIRPIAVGESLRRLTSKCLCSLIKEDASAFFQPFQFGVALPQGCEKCLASPSLTNAPYIFPSSSHGQHGAMANTLSCGHSMGTLTSEAGVQQGDPLGPFYFALVLHHLVLSISKDEVAKTYFSMHGEVAFCSSFIASKRAAASTLLSSLVKLGSCDPQIALILLRMCGGFTKLVHVARSTPPSLALDELHAFDEQVRCTFTECQAIDTTDSSWMQAQLSLSRGGLGLRSLAHHSNAAFIASISTAGLASPSDNFLADAVNSYNSFQLALWQACCLDLTVVSPLNPTFISEVGRTAGSAAVAAELRKHSANDAKCSELGWTCIPLVAESYGAWGSEAVQAFSRLASYLATRTNSPKSKVVCSLYGRLNLTLVRADARALLLRCGCSLQEGDISSS
eukprot:Em0851g2a